VRSFSREALPDGSDEEILLVLCALMAPSETTYVGNRNRATAAGTPQEIGPGAKYNGVDVDLGAGSAAP
jgi:hypothetical protein